ncbi:DNA damage-regulated autophagy modulator protein 1 [Dermacentor silvarum]|uniref:DNA damage-regulated autophagy modulator protein 1 n=1 Tax=Dermacentor silvarum TaxID=543639 RepID=UPI002101BC18|nr:DNA damage-regulated autophagy modulator protein 1 [Dermacentor silvarum]
MEVVITKLQYIPYFGALVGVAGIITSYAIAVSKGDVDPWLPYISDAGGDPPQSSIFSFSMILVSLCFLVGCCICYMIITVMNASQDSIVKWLSRLIPLAGAGCSAGMVLLAINPLGHLRRDGSWVSHSTPFKLDQSSKPETRIRLPSCLSFLSLSSFGPASQCSFTFFFSAFSAIAYCPISQADHLGPLPNSPRMYPDGILVSTISEWLVVMTFLAFTTSFAAEFRKFKLTLKLEYIAEPNSSRAQLKTPAESHGETSLKEESSTSQQ